MTILGVSDLPSTSLPTQPNSALFLKLASDSIAILLVVK